MTMNVTASTHEWHAMLNEEMPAVQYDIKQNPTRVCPPGIAARLYIRLSLNAQRCEPPRDARERNKRSGT
jgi:hypothetical protein